VGLQALPPRLALVLAVLLTGCLWAPERTTLTLQLHPDGSVPAGAALLETCDTLRRRLDRLDVSSAAVEPAGTDRIEVRLSRKDDSERVRHLLLAAPVFELRLVRLPAGAPRPSSQEEVLAHYGGKLPPDVEVLAEKVRGTTGTRYYAVERQAMLTGRDIESARPDLGPLGRRDVVEFSVKPEPAKAFSEATGANVGSFLAIVLDGCVVAAPRINSRLSNVGVIEGGFTPGEAEDLSILLGSGPLPGRLRLVEERVEEESQ
jgi:preprotein translocase subunit SecD